MGTSEGSVLEPIREYRNVTADLFRGEILARGQPRHALPGADLCGHRRPLLHRRLEGEYVTDTTTPAALRGGRRGGFSCMPLPVKRILKCCGVEQLSRPGISS